MSVAQLHGDGARAAVLDLPTHLEVIYVLHATPDGRICTPLPEELAGAAGRVLERCAVAPVPGSPHAEQSAVQSSAEASSALLRYCGGTA